MSNSFNSVEVEATLAFSATSSWVDRGRIVSARGASFLILLKLSRLRPDYTGGLFCVAIYYISFASGRVMTMCFKHAVTDRTT